MPNSPSASSGKSSGNLPPPKLRLRKTEPDLPPSQFTRDALFTLCVHFSQFCGAPLRKMVVLGLPITFCTPGTHALSKADRRRLHGTKRHATNSPLGPAFLEARSWQRGRLRLPRPYSYSCPRRPDALPSAK